MTEENNSDDENSEAPTPFTDWSNNDDDDPPAAGAVMVKIKEKNKLEISDAPTAEPSHQSNPMKITA